MQASSLSDKVQLRDLPGIYLPPSFCAALSHLVRFMHIVSLLKKGEEEEGEGICHMIYIIFRYQCDAGVRNFRNF